MVENGGLRRWSAVLLVVAFLAGACSGGGRPEAGAPLRLVSLGDSYPAGEGLANPAPPCGRTPGAYPNLVAIQPATAATLHACNGATTADVVDRERQRGEGRQIDAVTEDTDVVTISIGGNDLGFADVMRDCVLSELPCTRLDGTIAAALARLGPALERVYREIRTRAPNARLLVVGYPQLVADPDRTQLETCAGMTQAENRWVRQKGDELASVIRRTAEAGGARYLDAAALFAGHEACTPQPWMEGVNLMEVLASFHPNAAGHQQLARLVEAALPRPT